MRILIQRVKYASVTIDGVQKSKIGCGILAFVGFCEGDLREYLKPMAEKMTGLRIFEDESERMNLSLSDIQGDVLIASQFTLYADAKKGRRPSFTNALNPEEAKSYYEEFVSLVSEIIGREVKTGSFGADMKVELLNDGPVTILLDSEDIIKK